MTLWSYTWAASMSQQTTTTDDPQIPQPDLRFVIERQTNKSNNRNEKGARPNKHTHKHSQMLPPQWEKTHCDKSKYYMKSDQTNYIVASAVGQVKHKIYSQNQDARDSVHTANPHMDVMQTTRAFSQNTLSSSSPSYPVDHSVRGETILHQFQMLCNVAVPPTGRDVPAENHTPGKSFHTSYPESMSTMHARAVTSVEYVMPPNTLHVG